MNKRALQAIVAARSALIIDHAFFACLVLSMKPIEVPFIPTMATDGKALYYNANFVLEQSEDALVAIIAHEAYHCAYKHHLRMGDRDLDKWNEACDYVINYDLRSYGFKLPEWVLYDPKYAGLSAEEIYNLIPNQKQPKQQQGKEGKGQGGGQGQKQDSKGQGGKGKPSQSQGQPSQGDGQSGEGQFDAPDPGRMGGIIPAAPSWDKNTIESEEARWDALTRQAVNVAKADNAGRIPGFLERLVQNLERSRVDWETLLRKFVDESIERTYTWTNPNKRLLHRGLYLPGMVSDRLKHIVSVMDTSGSVNQPLIDKYAAEKRAMLDEGLCDKLTVIYADTKVQNVQEFERGDVVELLPKGGGGTNFRPAMDYIAEHCEDASIILFFTDLMTRDFGDDPGKPLIWTVYGHQEHFRNYSPRVPFGFTLHVEE